MTEAISDVIAKTAVYRDLTQEEAADLALGLELRRFAPGEPLMRQGDASDGAYVVASGGVTVSARMPGGGEQTIAELGPGDLVGEMALLTRGGKRSATARAQGEVEALFTDRRYFEAGLHLLRPASLKVLRRLSLTVGERLRAVRGRSRALIEASDSDSLFHPPPDDAPWSAPRFDVRAFLPVLPFLREFGAAELDRLFALGRVEAVPRGTRLAEEGETLQACRLVVRGALLVGHRHSGRFHQLDILGPGRFAGVAPLLEHAPSGVAIAVASDATLLTFGAEDFIRLWAGLDRLAFHLLEMVTSDFVLSLATANNHLTRLAIQARLRVFDAAA